MKLRKQRLGYDSLHMWDLAVPLVPNADTFVSWDTAKTTVFEGLGVLGGAYQELLQKAFNERWIDVYPNKGKQRGAYAWNAYGLLNPFVFMNHSDTTGDIFTLAHEMGHAIHAYHTHRHQPQFLAWHDSFVTEIVAKVNEALVMYHLLETTTDPIQYQYLLNYHIQQFLGSLYQQTMYAEFEMRTHAMVERGEALNAKTLNALYLGLSQKYHGSDVVHDEVAACAWSSLPHLYRPFYVYQYAIGFSAAIALSKKIREEGESGVAQYMQLLQSGASDTPLNLLKAAGVDMATPDPIRAALTVFGELLDKFEAITA